MALLRRFVNHPESSINSNQLAAGLVNLQQFCLGIVERLERAVRFRRAG